MVWRKTSAAAERSRKKVEAMKRGRERAAMAREPRGRMPDLPAVRRTVVVTDFDTGTPVVHTFTLGRAKRIDSYNVSVDGTLWKKCGWSAVCTALRKGNQRLPSPRSDFWW